MPNSFSLPNSRFRSPLAVGALIIIVLLLRGLGFSTAHADGGVANFDLQPVIDALSTAKVRSYFILDARPGNTMQGSIQVTNSGTATGTVSLYGVDATTGQTSGTVYLSPTDAQHDVGTWLRLSHFRLSSPVPFVRVNMWEASLPRVWYRLVPFSRIISRSMCRN